MSAVDVYRLQQAKFILTDASLLGGETFTLTDEKGKTKTIVIPIPTEGVGYYECLLDGGHVYTLTDSNDEIVGIKELAWGDLWVSGAIGIWDGSVYENGVYNTDIIGGIEKSGSFTISDYKFNSDHIYWDVYTATHDSPAILKITPNIKYEKIKNFNTLIFDGAFWALSSQASGSTIQFIGGLVLRDESSGMDVANLVVDGAVVTYGTTERWQNLNLTSPVNLTDGHEYAIYYKLGAGTGSRHEYLKVFTTKFAKA